MNKKIPLNSNQRRPCHRPWQVARAQGCLLGQICGDALGSQVEFSDDAASLHKSSCHDVREMKDGGVFNTCAGQPTDDSEMALALAHALVESGQFDIAKIHTAYRNWFESGPFDCGETIAAALCGHMNPSSQGNGALMRASPLGLFGAGRDNKIVTDMACKDAALTHPNPICQEANAVFVLIIANAVSDGGNPQVLHRLARQWAVDMAVSKEVIEGIDAARRKTWIDKSSGKQAWALVALQNALWQLLHAPNLEEGIVDTITRGGATGTNAAVCGALLGSVYGVEAIPERWRDAVLKCQPDKENPTVSQPRPREYWASDVLELSKQLISI